jgi:hypothetical protein
METPLEWLGSSLKCPGCLLESLESSPKRLVALRRSLRTCQGCLESLLTHWADPQAGLVARPLCLESPQRSQAGLQEYLASPQACLETRLGNQVCLLEGPGNSQGDLETRRSRACSQQLGLHPRLCLGPSPCPLRLLPAKA